MSEMCQDLGRKNPMVGREMRKKKSHFRRNYSLKEAAYVPNKYIMKYHIAIFLEEEFRTKVKTVVLLYL